MLFQNYPFFYLMFLSAIASGLVSYIGWKRRDVRGVRYFSIYTALIAWWSFFYALEITAIDPGLHILFLKIEYLAIPWIPGFVILFALYFGGYERIITWKTRILVFIIPILSFIAYFTNDYHHLYYQAIHPLNIDGLTVISIEPGIFYVLLTSYIFFCILFCFLIFLKILLQSPRVFLVQSLIFLTVLIMLMSGYLYYLFMPRLYPDFDITPIILAIGDFFVILEIFRYQFFDLVYVPHRKIVEHLHDGLVVLDPQDRILEMNQASQDILLVQDSNPIGKPLDQLGASIQEITGMLTADSAIHANIRLAPAGTVRDYAVDMYPVFDSINRLECRLIVIRDISDQIKSKNALKEAGKKLSLLTSITRHDILNQVMIVSGYARILSTSHQTAEQQVQVQRIADAAVMIQQLINFTSLYQDMGVAEPGWIDVGAAFEKAWNTRRPPSSITISIRTDLIIYADMLLEKVFFNLIDNSLRHGGTLSRITISSVETPDGAIVMYEDDGFGVAEAAKKEIFKRGFGSNTGYGLFLVKEILSITSITIRESGIPGEGVRFEMSVPGGGYAKKP